MRASLQVVGARESADALAISASELHAELASTREEIAEEMLDAVDVPATTGALASTVRPITERGAGLLAGGGDVDYAAAVHQGRLSGDHGTVAPRPFLDDAANRVERKACEMFEDDLAAIFDRRLSRGARP